MPEVFKNLSSNNREVCLVWVNYYPVHEHGYEVGSGHQKILKWYN